MLVNGATGAIGSAAVQLLADLGVRVTAVCGAAHLELVRGLGADRLSQNAVLPVVTRLARGRRVMLPTPVEAYRYVETGQKLGNVVITVVPSGQRS